MTACIDAANRYLDQFIHSREEDFRSSLAGDVLLHHCRLNGVFQSNHQEIRGANEVFELFKRVFFDVTKNFDVKEWKVKCCHLTANCKYSIDQDKDDSKGLQGRYNMSGKLTLVFKEDPSGGDLLIQEIWDATAAKKIKSASIKE